MKDGTRYATGVDIEAPGRGPEEIPDSNQGYDEVVLARFGKRQQLRVSIRHCQLEL